MANYPRVLCLGEILFDIISDQPGVAYEDVTAWTAYPGGAPANVACALAKLGTPAGFVGCVGRDRPGEELVTLLKDIGVATNGVQLHEALPTREIYVIRTADGDRQFVGFGDRATDEFADTALQGDKLPIDQFAQADYLALGTLELPYPETAQAIDRALALAKQHDVKVVLDVNWRPMFWPQPEAAKATVLDFMQQAHILKVADEEAEWLFDTADPSAIAQRLPNANIVLVTAGAKGCAYSILGNQGHRAAFNVEVQETTGAGDGFLAGFLHQCAQGFAALNAPEAAREAVTYACAVGALTTMKPGAIAAQPTAAEVDEFLQARQAQQVP
ncbi:MAG: carbohydrate kinase [Cyanobacteria bacterium P01_A01_bin.135]